MGAYLEVLRRPGVRRPVTGTVLASAPIGVLGLAVLLVIRRSGGTYATAGLAAGLLALGTATGMVVQGRLIDRYGQPPVLLIAAVVQATALIALVASPPAAVPACAFAAGAAEPQVTASLRALWSDLVPGRLRPAAMTLSSVLFETPVLIGPLLLTLWLLVGPPAGAVLLAAAMFLTGTVLLATSPAARAWRGPDTRDGHITGALRRPAVRAVLVVTAGHGAVIGAVQVCAAARAASLAGVLYATLSAGSLAGAALLGRRVQSGRPVGWLTGLTAAAGLALVAAAAARPLLVLGAALLVTGGSLGPAGVLTYTLAGRFAPAGRTVEAFTLVTASALGTLAAGAAVAGVLADRIGPARTLLITAAYTLVLAVVVAARGAQFRGAENAE
jgi:MFS family permease